MSASKEAKKSEKSEAECAFCDFMHKSPCAAPFIEWEKCHEKCTENICHRLGAQGGYDCGNGRANQHAAQPQALVHQRSVDFREALLLHYILPATVLTHAEGDGASDAAAAAGEEEAHFD